VFDLTDAGGEVFPWASGCCDMGPTLVPCRGRPRVGVVGCVVAARVGSCWRGGRAQRKANRGGLAFDEGGGKEDGAGRKSGWRCRCRWCWRRGQRVRELDEHHVQQIVRLSGAQILVT